MAVGTVGVGPEDKVLCGHWKLCAKGTRVRDENSWHFVPPPRRAAAGRGEETTLERPYTHARW